METNKLNEHSDAELIVELRQRLERASDEHLSKLGIMLLNLGSDAVIAMGDRNVRAAIHEGIIDPADIPDIHAWSNGEEPEVAPHKRHDEEFAGEHGDHWATFGLEDSEADEEPDPDDGLDGDFDEPYTPGPRNPYGHMEDAHLEREYEDRISGDYEVD